MREEEELKLKILRRFVLQPRSDYMRYGSWLVIYDTKTEKYVPSLRDKSYAKFNDSHGAFEWIYKNYEDINIKLSGGKR